jgi:NAD(P)-dependent dehydrogenase (short-subunit alcohol dehydrogenase family)
MTAVALTVRRGSCIIVHTKSPLEHGSGNDEMQVLTTLHFMTRLGEAGEVAHLVHFLASGPASFLTTAYFTVAGGISCGRAVVVTTLLPLSRPVPIAVDDGASTIEVGETV